MRVNAGAVLECLHLHLWSGGAAMPAIVSENQLHQAQCYRAHPVEIEAAIAPAAVRVSD